MLGLESANMRFVLLGSMLIGATGGLLGTFAVLRKRSLLGDALAHSALPGVALAFLITGSKELVPLLAGATLSGILGVFVIHWITTHSRVKADAALGLVLTVFFGLGVVLLTHIQQSAYGNQSGLDKFLFGQAASLVTSDLKIMSILMIIIIGAVVLFYKEFKLLIFDQDFLRSSGFPSQLLDLLLMGLIVLTIMTGLQAVGVILIAAMLITPAAAARFWSERLSRMIFTAMGFGMISGIIGTYASASAPGIPTGPVMVLTVTSLFLISALFAPRRGLLARWMLQRRNRRRESIQHFLKACFEILEQSDNKEHLRLESVAGKMKTSYGSAQKLSSVLRKKGLITIKNGKIHLTEKGQKEALFVIKSHRLWEHYLLFRSVLDEDHVHQPADEIEHILTPEILDRLEHLLEEQGIDTKSVVHHNVS